MNRIKVKYRHLLILLTILAVLSPLLFSNSPLPVYAQTTVCAMPFQHVAIPLTELGNGEYNRMNGAGTGFAGGLYPNGENTRPPAHEQAGLLQASSILPLDADGNFDPENGKVVFISIGMSNTSSEFGEFSKNVKDEENINPYLALANGAQASQTADRWLELDSVAWQQLAGTLRHLRLSPAQVQVAWIKLTLTQGGDFPAKAQTLQDNLETIVRNLKMAYPNVKIAYLSSRIFSYTYNNGLSPEPLAYETGFSVKWMIEKQINGDPGLNFDPQVGPVVAPFLSWGPYLWADGQNPRADGLVWLQEDLTEDCTHPSLSGRQKVAAMLMDFFKTDSTSRLWFLENYRTYFPLITATVTGQPQMPFAPTNGEVSPPQTTFSPTGSKTAPDLTNTMLRSTTPAPTTTATPAPSVKIALTLTPLAGPALPPVGQPRNLFAWLTDWFRRLFSRR